MIKNIANMEAVLIIIVLSNAYKRVVWTSCTARMVGLTAENLTLVYLPLVSL